MCIFHSRLPANLEGWLWSIIATKKALHKNVRLLKCLLLYNGYSLAYLANFTFTAFNPFLPSAMSNVTSSFSLIRSTNPDVCTKYSVEELVSLIKPKPLASLKNFTVPLFIKIVFKYYAVKIEIIIEKKILFRLFLSFIDFCVNFIRNSDIEKIGPFNLLIFNESGFGHMAAF